MHLFQILQPPTIADIATLDKVQVNTVRGMSCAPFRPLSKPVAELPVNRLGYGALMRAGADRAGSYRNRNGPQVARVLPPPVLKITFKSKPLRIQCIGRIECRMSDPMLLAWRDKRQVGRAKIAKDRFSRPFAGSDTYPDVARAVSRQSKHLTDFDRESVRS
jgi:hypothetical protein